MDSAKKMMLEEKAKQIRYLTVDCIATLGQGHIGGSLSIADLLSVLYFDVMKVDPENPKMEGRDRLVCSKGHAGPAVYAALAAKGFFPLEMLHTLNKPYTNLPSHCDMNRTPGIDMTTGSLGQGVSCAIGMAKAAKLLKEDSYVYAIIGDGESDEGQVWEAAMAASQFKLDNLIIFLDHNNAQIDGTTEEVMSLGDPAARWGAFGFNTYTVDGHDVEAIDGAIAEAKAKKGAPSIIIMNTVKGKGVSFVEGTGVTCHYMTFTPEMKEQALKELS
ncbi:transketolase [Anaerolentibacter hominis]|uniref:transketolase n=1 Tax=Anaerolentibacter hominis TaxID=3079009 RepID=UPI0031B825B9